jgi:hypothetical protein
MSILLSCFACVALAQATAAPPVPRYASPFADYRRFDAESPPKGWREANQEVREAGGHVGIVKGMSGPAAATAAGKSPAGGASGAAPPDKSIPAEPGKAPAKPGDKPATGHSHGSHK